MSAGSIGMAQRAALSSRWLLRGVLVDAPRRLVASSGALSQKKQQQEHQQEPGAFASIGQISMQANLEKKWSRLPMPKENLQFRLATMADKAEVLRIEPDVHYGLDYMQDYYEEIVTHESRCGLVAVDKTSKKLLTFVYAIVNEGGRNLSFGGGRTVPGFRDYGLMSFATRALFEHLQSRLHRLAGCCGVYNLPVYTRRFFENRQAMLKVVLHSHQLGFECTADYCAQLADRFAAASGADPIEPRQVPNPVEFLSSEAACSGTENRLFKPDQHLLIAKESLVFSRGNLLIWQNFLQQVMASHPEPGSSGAASSNEVSGVSIGNWNTVPIGGIHLMINVYCRSEADAVSHLAAQLRAAVRQIQLQDPQHHRLFISAYVPSHLLYNEVLCGVRVHPLLKDLPQSYLPKLACDMRIGAWAPGGYI